MAQPPHKKPKLVESNTKLEVSEGRQFYVPLIGDLKPPTSTKPPTLEQYVRGKLNEDQSKRATETLQSKVESKHLLLHNQRDKRAQKLEKDSKPKKLLSTDGKIITSKERKKFKVHELPAELAKYDVFFRIHELWQQYITDALAGSSGNDLKIRLGKADFHGAIVKVAQSKCPNYVGIEGIIFQETANTFKIVTKSDQVKTVPKQGTVFSVIIGGKLLTLYGTHMCLRASERSARKFKTKVTIDIFE